MHSARMMPGYQGEGSYERKMAQQPILHTALAPVDRNPDPIVPILDPTSYPEPSEARSKRSKKYTGRGDARRVQPLPATSAGHPLMG